MGAAYLINATAMIAANSATRTISEQKNILRAHALLPAWSAALIENPFIEKTSQAIPRKAPEKIEFLSGCSPRRARRENRKTKGAQAAPFYAWVAARKQWQPSWNFNKVLIGRDGLVAGTFGSGDEPQGAKLTKAIAAALQG